MNFMSEIEFAGLVIEDDATEKGLPRETRDAIVKRKHEWRERIFESDLTYATKVFANVVINFAFGAKTVCWPNTESIQAKGRFPNNRSFASMRGALVECGALTAVKAHHTGKTNRYQNYKYYINLDWDGSTATNPVAATEDEHPTPAHPTGETSPESPPAAPQTEEQPEGAPEPPEEMPEAPIAVERVSMRDYLSSSPAEDDPVEPEGQKFDVHDVAAELLLLAKVGDNKPLISERYNAILKEAQSLTGDDVRDIAYRAACTVAKAHDLDTPCERPVVEDPLGGW